MRSAHVRFTLEIAMARTWLAVPLAGALIGGTMITASVLSFSPQSQAVPAPPAPYVVFAFSDLRMHGSQADFP